MSFMTCRECGAENRPGRKFCGECGATLALSCPACGTANEPDEKFCGECGAALDAELARPELARDPERRLVSVLFADLVGFTTISEHRDPEEVRKLLSTYVDARMSANIAFGYVTVERRAFAEALGLARELPGDAPHRAGVDRRGVRNRRRSGARHG